jgi:two-component system aerobic respiration control sensor histidine kinase ArcB
VTCPGKEPKEKFAQSTQLSLSILLVEDIELNILVATALLEKLGHKVDIAKNGAQAIEKVANQQYQLILMDIQLPDMDGYQVTQKLRQIHGDKLPPVVALTANVFADKQRFIEQGMDDALGKPLGIAPLNEMIQRLFAAQDEDKKAAAAQAGKSPVQTDAVLDEPMLTELLEFLPVSVMLDNVDLFEKMMPDYLHVLDSNMTAKDKKGIVSEAHKIKGAAGSVGLKRIQELSQKVQSPDLPAWWDNIDDWVELIQSQYQHDINLLKQWIVAHKK